jgi:hypothetical protein
MKTKVILLGLLVAGLSWPLLATVYVNASASGANNGTSWTNAYTNLTSAIGTAGAEIHVASGTYVAPATNSGFILANNITLLGGYNSANPSDAVRDPAAYVTNLSGDVNSDDTFADLTADPCALATACTTGNHKDNARILNMNTKTGIVIDGFTLKEGFDRNGSAAAALCAGTGAFTFNNCLFTQNYASNNAGCIYGDYGIFIVTNCRFIQNSTYNRGAAIYVYGSDGATGPLSAVTVSNCLFQNNANLNDSGSIYVRGHANTTVTDSCFEHCWCICYNGNSGGIHYICFDQNGTTLGLTPTLTVTNCSFNNCKGTSEGSAVFFQTFKQVSNAVGTANLTNCLVTNTSSFADNGSNVAVDIANSYTEGYTPVHDVITMNLLNCTITNNTASAHGQGAVGCSNNFPVADTQSHTTLTLKNTIVWGTTGGTNAQIFLDTTAPGFDTHVTFTADYCCVDNSDPNDYLYGATSPTTNVLTRLNGAAVVPAPNPQFDAGYFLGATSSCRSNGNNVYVTGVPTDLSGRPRINGAGTVDMGCYAYYLPADIDGNNKVNLVDFELLAAAWLDAGCSVLDKWCGNADTNHGGTVDMADLSNLTSEWLQ